MLFRSVTGYLVDSGDAQQFAERVVMLLRDPALRQKMGTAGREHVLSHFSAEQMAMQFMTALDQAISGA